LNFTVLIKKENVVFSAWPELEKIDTFVYMNLYLEVLIDFPREYSSRS
jgi:hypothetical protein